MGQTILCVIGILSGQKALGVDILSIRVKLLVTQRLHALPFNITSKYNQFLSIKPSKFKF